MRNKQAGFKFFEFILVVILIGTIFIFSISYYLQLLNEARRLTFQSLGHNFSTAVTMSHARWLIYKISDKASDRLNIASLNITFNTFGWPIDIPSEIGSTSCARLFNGLIQNNTEALTSWRGLLQAAAIVSSSGKENVMPSAFVVSKLGDGWCRYELRLPSGAHHFFDYLSVNGQVNIKMTNY